MFKRRRRSRFADLIRSRVALVLKDGDTVYGILIGEWDDSVSIASGRLLTEAAGDAIVLDGETVVPLANIRYAQVGVMIEGDEAQGRQLRSVAS